MVKIGGVKFGSLRQNTSLITSNLSSGSYHVFMDVNTLLDALSSSHLSDKDSINEKYHAQRVTFKTKVQLLSLLLSEVNFPLYSVKLIRMLWLVFRLLSIRHLMILNIIRELSSAFLIRCK